MTTLAIRGGEHTEPVYYTKVICRKISGGREWLKWIPYDGLQTVREAISTAQQAAKDDENTYGSCLNSIVMCIQAKALDSK